MAQWMRHSSHVQVACSIPPAIHLDGHRAPFHRQRAYHCGGFRGGRTVVDWGCEDGYLDVFGSCDRREALVLHRTICRHKLLILWRPAFTPRQQFTDQKPLGPSLLPANPNPGRFALQSREEEGANKSVSSEKTLRRCSQAVRAQYTCARELEGDDRAAGHAWRRVCSATLWVGECTGAATAK